MPRWLLLPLAALSRWQRWSSPSTHSRLRVARRPWPPGPFRRRHHRPPSAGARPPQRLGAERRPAHNGGSAPNGGSGQGGSQPAPDPGRARHRRARPDRNPSRTQRPESCPPSQYRYGVGLGSGFVADGSGDILTANHVVEGSTQVTVKLQDGSTVHGTVVASDPSIDTAVVKIDRTDVPPLQLGDSDQVRVGQAAIAVGSPFGLDETVTSGIVSALNRTLQTQGGQLSGLIQTDAPINPGNSGGPLTDRDGTVIGINDAIASTSGQSSGVGFAVPINDAKRLLEQVQNGTAAAPQGGQGGEGSPGGQGQPGGPVIPGNGGPFGGLNPFGNTDPNGNADPNGNTDPRQACRTS